MNLVTQMALKGTRASEAWERQVQPQLEPQSRHVYLTLQDLAEMPCPAWADRTWQGLVDMPCLGQVDNSCQGWVGPLSQDQVDVWRQGLVVHCPRVKRTCWTMTWWTCCVWDLVAMCRPWPEDQEATFSICILFEERRGVGPQRNGPTVDTGMERKWSA